MPGSLRERRPGVWELRVGAGRDQRGRYRQLSRTVHGDRAAAERALAELAAGARKAPRRRRKRRRQPIQVRSAVQTRPYQLEALEAAMGRPSSAILAELLGVDRRQVERWRSSGLTAHQADAVAVAGGLHPGNVWPEWWLPMAP